MRYTDRRRRNTIPRSHALLTVLIGLGILGILTFFGFFTENLLKMSGSQWTLSLIILASILATGFVVKIVLDANNAEGQITWTELVIGGVAAGILFAGLGVNIGWKIAYQNTVTFNQNLNGWENGTPKNDVTCTEDGNCVHTYSCHPYTVWVQETYSCGTSDNPKTCSRTVPKTKYHSCPYVTVETSYYVTSTLGTSYTMGQSCMPAGLNDYRWDPTVPIDTSGACVGIPPAWAAAKARVDSGHPGPTTQRGTYVNYVLPGDKSTVQKYAAQIAQLKAAGFIPDIPHTIRDQYYEDRVLFVGFTPANPGDWENTMAYFDSGCGNELRCDTYLVIVRGQLPVDPDTYLNAFRADWTDIDVHGKDALPKNAILVIVHSANGENVDWARATTGMPVGNEKLISAINGLEQQVELTPQAVIGVLDGQFYIKTKADGTTKQDVKTVGTDGLLRQAIWGLKDEATKFCRVSMSGNSDCGSGFLFLKDQIKPSFGMQLTIVLVMIILGGILWYIEAFYVGDLRYN